MPVWCYSHRLVLQPLSVYRNSAIPHGPLIFPQGKQCQPHPHSLPLPSHLTQSPETRSSPAPWSRTRQLCGSCTADRGSACCLSALTCALTVRSQCFVPTTFCWVLGHATPRRCLYMATDSYLATLQLPAARVAAGLGALTPSFCCICGSAGIYVSRNTYLRQGIVEWKVKNAGAHSSSQCRAWCLVLSLPGAAAEPGSI
jgi:hypothetical protein